MLNLGTLNILIAMVIVILVLSLVVQSLQQLTKKVLKLKSRSILNSLEDLFETIINKPGAASAAVTGTPSKTPMQLVNEVTDRLKEMGRKSLFGNAMFDSLAKGDLLKILTRVRAEDLLPGAVGNFQSILAQIQTLKEEVGKVETNLLQGEASARFAAMQGSIMPLLHDLEALASGGKIDTAVFFGDLSKVRQIKAAEVLATLGQVQEGVNNDLLAVKAASDDAQKALAEAQQSSNQAQIDAAKARDQEATGKLEAVKAVDMRLKEVANQIAKLSTAFDAALAPLTARLEQVEVWYDTVMQGFQERYTRHMKTVGLVISIGVVVVLNANFFTIYKTMKADADRTASMVEQFEKDRGILKTAPQKNETQTGATNPAATATPSSAPATPPSVPAASATPTTPAGSVAGGPGASPAPTATPGIGDDAKKAKALAAAYESFGLKPLSRKEISDVFTSPDPWKGLGETILGWGIMVILLSAGAPFWEDTLESLFGLKNLLRQKSDTKNIEGEKGGQPKP